MTWGVLSPDGRIAAVNGREASAVLNAKGRAVVELPAEVAASPLHWRFGPGFAWSPEARDDPNAVRLAAMDRDGRRREAYAGLDRDRLTEVTAEVVLALAEQPEVWALLRQTTKDKIGQLQADIAAVKTANP